MSVRHPLTQLHRLAGATVGDDGVPVAYGPLAAAYRACQDSAALVDLGMPQVVDLTGDDVRRWANGMFTQNLRDMPLCAVFESGWCDDRGRLIGLFRGVLLADDHLRVVLEGHDADAFIEHFDRYVLVDDVVFANVSAQYRLFVAYGPRRVQALGAAGLHLSRDAQVTDSDSATLLPWKRANVPSVDLLVKDAAAVAVWTALIDAGFAAAATELDTVLRVEAGRAAVPDDVPGKALPHELALRERILSFTKGCYVGQETINRLDVRGQTRRALAGVLCDGPVRGGDALHLADKAVGVLSSVVCSPRLGWIGLAVVRRPHEEGATVRIPTALGERVGRVVPLPFAVDDTPFPAPLPAP